MAYLYRHIRMDKNIPFYIGIGSDEEYKRASATRDRSQFWKHIVAKTEYEIDIILDGLTWKRACEKEIEFISLYKRVKDGGTLCNITLGGEGKLGVIPTNAYKKGSVPYSKGKPMPPHVKSAIIKAVTGKPSWNKGKPMSEDSRQKMIKSVKKSYLGRVHFMLGKKQNKEWVEKSRLSRLGIEPWNKGKKWTRDELAKTKITNAHDDKRITICQYSLDGELVQVFISIAEAERQTGVGKGCISLCVQGKRRMTGGFLWKKAGGFSPPTDQPI